MIVSDNSEKFAENGSTDAENKDTLMTDTADEVSEADVQIVEGSDLGDFNQATAAAEKKVQVVQAHATLVPVISVLIVFSIIGCYLRILLEQAAPDSILMEYSIGNFLGSWIYSFIQIKPHKTAINFIYHPLHVAIGTSFCGSLTTFSSWQLEAAEFIAFYTGPFTMGQRAYSWFQVELLSFAVSMVSYDFGFHCPLKFWPVTYESKNIEISAEKVMFLKEDIREYIAVFSGVIAVALVSIITSFYPSETNFALCFAPLGAILRWRLNKFDKIHAEFPVGTFIANVAGCCLLAIAEVLQDGFCGSLTTVSRWIFELRIIKSIKYRYLYGISSIVLSQALMSIILGAYSWSRDGSIPQESEYCF